MREQASADGPGRLARAGVDVALERLIRRDRWVVVGALVLVVLLAWAYLLGGAGMGMSALEMTRLSQQAPAGGPGSDGGMSGVSWTASHATLMFVMWWVMMIAMMLPGAAPMVLLFAAINCRQHEGGHPHVSTALFVAAYLLTWAGFSLLAVLLQWSLQVQGWLSPLLVSHSEALNGTLLILAGVYQLTAVKQACLRQCRSPLLFITRHWRVGHRGAFGMGARHGAYCVGCCWFLMGLLFLGGVMNLWWILGLALFVLLEKSAPAGRGFGRASGLGLLVLGAWLWFPGVAVSGA